MEEKNNILSRYDAVAKQAVNFDIDLLRWYSIFDLKCQIALVLGADPQDVNDCLSVYDVDYLIYKTYGGELSKQDLKSDYDVLVATIAILDSGIDTSILDSEYIAEMALVNLIVPVQSNKYFYVEPLNDNTEFTINSVDGAPVLNLEYSMDGKTWQSWDYKTNHITANANEKVYLRGQNEAWSTIVGASEGVFDNHHYNSIISVTDAEFNIGGRLSSLFTGNEEDSDKSIIMTAIFYNSKCRDASKLIVPRNAKLSFGFSGCSSLISAPRTLSDSIHESQYYALFFNCTSLSEAPQLPATTLAPKCYRSMFFNCTSLTEAPELPATTLAEECYISMFSRCTSLTNAPELPATTLAPKCYNGMFYACNALTSAPKLSATTLAENSCDGMFIGCTSLTSFNFGDQSIFADSTNSLSNMFNGCSKLSYIRILFDDRDGAGPREYTNWTKGVASQGTFVTNTDKWKRGANGIPNGWEVVIEGASA